MESSKKCEGKQQLLLVLAASVAGTETGKSQPQRRERVSVFVDTRQAKPKDQQRVMFLDPANIYSPAVM